MGDRRPVWAGLRGCSRHGREHIHVGLHTVDLSGSEGDCDRRDLYDISKGHEHCRGADRIAFPVIILTGARHAAGDQVLGIERGASDYIVKGTDRQVLLARVRGALRDRAPETRVIASGRLRIDMASGEAWLGERALKLERRPQMMLQLLAGRPGEVVGREELLERVWGTTYTGFDHSVEQAAHQIRRALKEPGWIETVRGLGYRFVAQP